MCILFFVVVMFVKIDSKRFIGVSSLSRSSFMVCFTIFLFIVLMIIFGLCVKFISVVVVYFDFVFFLLSVCNSFGISELVLVYSNFVLLFVLVKFWMMCVVCFCMVGFLLDKNLIILLSLLVMNFSVDVVFDGM